MLNDVAMAGDKMSEEHCCRGNQWPLENWRL